jgi:8-oxo-dGTP pyrophosphatase MutT (NUDIX family)
MKAPLRDTLRRAGIPIRKLAWEGERLRWRLFHPVTLGARVVLLRGDEVLLIRHTYRAGWYFPGGGVDKGETLDAAACREAEEEAQATVNSLELLGVYANFGEGKSDHVAVFVARDFELREFVPNNEIAERSWFPLDELPDSLSAATRRRLEELAAGGVLRSGNW